MGLATPLDRREVGDHSTAEDDAEAVGSLGRQHSAGRESDLERIVGGDDFGGFGIDDIVGHCGRCKLILRLVGWGGQSGQSLCCVSRSSMRISRKSFVRSTRVFSQSPWTPSMFSSLLSKAETLRRSAIICFICWRYWAVVIVVGDGMIMRFEGWGGQSWW